MGNTTILPVCDQVQYEQFLQYLSVLRQVSFLRKKNNQIIINSLLIFNIKFFPPPTVSYLLKNSKFSFLLPTESGHSIYFSLVQHCFDKPSQGLSAQTHFAFLIVKQMDLIKVDPAFLLDHLSFSPIKS